MSGILTVTPGYAWSVEADLLAQSKERQLTSTELAQLAVTTEKLDLTAQPSAVIAPASIGKREVIASAVQAIGASVTGGLRVTYQLPAAIVNVGVLVFIASIAVPGATVAMVPVIGTSIGVGMIIVGFVSGANTVSLYAINAGDTNRTLPAGLFILVDVI